MKALWTVLSIIAVANILAIAALFTWLQLTHRLNSERIDRVRLVFAVPLEVEAAAAAEAEAKALERERERMERQRMSIAPETAISRIARQEQAEQVRLQHILRQQRDLEDLRRAVERDRARLADEENRLIREREEFEAYRQRLAEIEGAQQFRKALATLESQRPKDARDVLQSLITDGMVEQVVSYLSAMEERTRGRIIAEFVKEGPELAADLLERIRTRGLSPTAPPPTPVPVAQSAESTAAPPP